MGILIGGGIEIGGLIFIGPQPTATYMVEEDLTTIIVSEVSSGSQNIIEEQP